MSLNYLVSDSLIRIKNGLSTKLFSVNLKYSKYILNIIKVLYTEGFILGYNIKRDLKNIKNNSIEVLLKYDQNQDPIIYKIQLLSKPGHRRYVSVRKLISLRKKYINLNNLYIVSTPLGVMSDVEAIQLNVGGELICKIN
jgi:small subunit ribosomal protein S8|uniref:Ribosomal protein S8 n=1 Tax=Thecamonas trahens TaxID=529818 RepID=A0A0B5H4P8_THETB|nr:ribosomal protein S8 [Thecamonas trahens]AJF36639.1 ribosomal protein S8 [Thecamonas trahens]